MKSKTVIAFIVVCFAIGCAAALPVIRTIIDIARLLCENAASEQPIEVLDNETPKAWCAHEKNLRPFIDGIVDAKSSASQKAGIAQ